MLDQGVTFNMFEEIQKTKTEEEEVKWLKLIHKVLVSWDKQSSEWVTIIDHTFSLLEQRQPYAIFYFKSPIKIPEIEGKMTTGTSKEDYEEAKLLPPENVYLLENISVSAYQVRKIDTSWKALIFVESGNVKEIPIREKWVIVRPKQFEVVYQGVHKRCAAIQHPLFLYLIYFYITPVIRSKTKQYIYKRYARKIFKKDLFFLTKIPQERYECLSGRLIDSRLSKLLFLTSKL